MLFTGFLWLLCAVPNTYGAVHRGVRLSRFLVAKGIEPVDEEAKNEVDRIVWLHGKECRVVWSEERLHGW